MLTWKMHIEFAWYVKYIERIPAFSRMRTIFFSPMPSHGSQIDVYFLSSLGCLQLKLIPISCFVGPGSANIPKVSAKLSEKHVQVISIWSWAIAPNLGSLRSTHSRVWVSRITLVLSIDRPPAVQWHHHGVITVDEAQKGNRYVHPNRVSVRRQAFCSW